MSKIYTTYKFGDFVLDEQTGTLSRNGADVKEQNNKFGTKHIQILLLLVENNNQNIKRKEIVERFWGSSFGGSDDFNTHLSVIRKVLGVSVKIVKEAKQNKQDIPFYIRTSGGICSFIGDVKPEIKVSNSETSGESLTTAKPNDDFSFNAPDDIESSLPNTEANTASPAAAESAESDVEVRAVGSDDLPYEKYANWAALAGIFIAAIFSGRGISGVVLSFTSQTEYFFVLLNSVCYGLLIVVCLFLEIAYRYDRYRSPARKVCVPIFLINCGAMLCAFTAANRWLAVDLGWAMGSAVLILFAATAASGVLAIFAVPNRPLVVAEFSTQPALMAFWKNTGYWLTAFSFFNLLVFCLFFHPSESFAGIGYPLSLFAVFWLLAIGSLFGTFYTLSDRLLSEKNGESYPYKTLYSNLLFSRAFFWIFPSAVNVSWYLFWSLQRQAE